MGLRAWRSVKTGSRPPLTRNGRSVNWTARYVMRGDGVKHNFCLCRCSHVAESHDENGRCQSGDDDGDGHFDQCYCEEYWCNYAGKKFSGTVRGGCVKTNAMIAHEHWRMHRLEGRQPIVRKGMRITVVRNGVSYTDVVTDVQFNKETGEEKITMGEVENPMQKFSAALQDSLDLIDKITKPTLRQRVWRWISGHLRRS